MHFLRTLVIFVPAAWLMAQAPPKPAPQPPKSITRPLTILGPDGKPLPASQQPTVTLEAENAGGQGPSLDTLPPDKVLVTIGEEKITAGELNAMIDSIPPQYRRNARGERRRDFVEEVVRIRLLANEARRRKLDESPAYKSQLAFQADNLLAGSVLEAIRKSAPIDETAARAWYEKNKAQYERVHARHILIRIKGSPVPIRPDRKDLTDEEALAKVQELRKKLAGGADFTALAQAESDDTGSAPKGGDLPAFQHGQMVPSFEQAAFAMSVGQISEPVKTQFGYHLIKVEEKTARTFEEVRAEVETRMRPEVAKKAVDEMRKSAAVTLDPVLLGK